MKMFSVPALTALILISGACSKKMKQDNITFHIYAAPFSADPYDFDHGVHHRSFRSVLGTLTSQNSIKGDIGYIAESWENSNNFKTWTFKIKKGLTFADDSPITPKIIEKSYKRLGLIAKKNNSAHPFFQALSGYEKLKSVKSEIDGIVTSSDIITFNFKSPMPRLIHHTSFGLFGIVSPVDYNDDGSWKHKKRINASGGYEIKGWNEDSLTISRRKSTFLDYGHKNKIDQIKIIWKDIPKDTELISGTSEDILSDEYNFKGDLVSGIAYAHCYSWKQSNKAMSDVQNRRTLRDYFKSELASRGFVTKDNFFPSTKPRERKKSQSNKLDFTVTIANFRIDKFKYTPIISNILKETTSLINRFIGIEESHLHLDPNYPNMSVDCRMSMTSILLESPKEDLHLMFLTKEGIQLPDPSGKIRKLVLEENIDLEAIEDQLWEDSIIWPITHFANGLWTKTGIDLSKLNTVHPPADFMWIGFDD